MGKSLLSATIEHDDSLRLEKIRQYTQRWYEGASTSSAVRAAIRLYSDLIQLKQIDQILDSVKTDLIDQKMNRILEASERAAAERAAAEREELPPQEE